MKNRKILSAVLTAAILAGSVMPSYTAFAESWVGDQAAATPAAQADGAFPTSGALTAGTYTLTENVTLTDILTVSTAGVTIDLNGHTLTGSDKTTIIVESGGSLTVKDSGSAGKIIGKNTTSQEYCIWVKAGGTLNWESGAFEDIDIGTYVAPNGNTRLTSIEVDGTANISGGSFTSTKGCDVLQVKGAATLANATFTSTGTGCTSAGKFAGANQAMNLMSTQKITMTNCAVNGTIWVQTSEVAISGANTNIQGSLLYGNADDGDNAKVDFADGTFSGEVWCYTSGSSVAFNSGNVEITGLAIGSVTDKANFVIGEDVNFTPPTNPSELAYLLSKAENITLPEGTEFNESGEIVATVSKVPEGYVGLTLAANANGDIYGVSMTEDELKALHFSPVNTSIGRAEPGYYPGFYVPAMDTDKNGGTATYKRAFTYVANLTDAAIKGLSYATPTDSNGNISLSTDGQFWPCIKKSYLTPTGKDSTPYLVYAIEAAYGADKMYYYIAVDWTALPEDFAFGDEENCTGTHNADTACAICGNVLKFTIEDTTTDTNGTVAIKDAAGKDVEKAKKGDKITITVSPATGYVLDKLEVNGTEVTVTDNSYEYTMTAADVTVKATFKAAAVAVESVALTQTTAELTVGGDNLVLSAKVSPANATDRVVTWKSSDETVATVDANGVVKAVAAGTATITVTTKDGGKTATCAVTVKAAKAEDETVTLKAGEKKTVVTKTDATAKTRTENTVLVIPADVAKNNAGVKVTVKAGTWTKTSALIKTCYAKVVHTDENGVKTTVSAGSDFVIAVEVTDIPDSITAVEYSFAPANE